MRQFIRVLGFELGNYYKNKSFVVTTVVIVLAAVLLVAVPPVIPGFLDSNDNGTQLEYDLEESLIGIYFADEVKTLEKSFDKTLWNGDWVIYDSPKKLREAVKGEGFNRGFIVNDFTNYVYVVKNNTMADQTQRAFEEYLLKTYQQQLLETKGIGQEESQEILNVNIISSQEILGKDAVGNYLYTYILVFILYILILLYGQMIATSITTEKSNRAIEILVTSVNSNSLIFGKVLAGAIAGIMQTGIILVSAFGTYGIFREEWGNRLDFLFHVPNQVWIVFSIFGILGYLLYAFIYGILGALVSKTEDISKSATFITLIYIVSFLIAIILGMDGSDNSVVRIASFIPFTSSNSMLVRVAMGTVQIWEIALSAIILVVSCIGTGILAAKLFRMGTLMYGNPVKFTTALKKISQEDY